MDLALEGVDLLLLDEVLVVEASLATEVFDGARVSTETADEADGLFGLVNLAVTAAATAALPFGIV